jgi:hypothetical protein
LWQGKPNVVACARRRGSTDKSWVIGIVALIAGALLHSPSCWYWSAPQVCMFRAASGGKPGASAAR